MTQPKEIGVQPTGSDATTPRSVRRGANARSAVDGKSRGQPSSSSLDRIAIAITAAVLLAALGAVSPASGSLAIALQVNYPALLAVGDTNVPVSLTISNASSRPESAGGVIVTLIRHTPSCGTDEVPCPAGFEDPDIFRLPASAVGRARTACEGMTFRVGVPNGATGEVEFVPDAELVVLQGLGSFSACTIDFSVDVLKLPTHDFDPSPLIQTAQLARATFTSTVTDSVTFKTASTLATVLQPTPTPAGTPPSGTPTNTPPGKPTVPPRGGIQGLAVVQVNYPAGVTVGDTKVPVSLTISIVYSAGVISEGNVVVSNIRHTPSCGTDTVPCPAGFEDPDVFQLPASAVGRARTACQGKTLTVQPPNVTTGEVEFVPDAGPVVLQPSGAFSSCTIDFLVDAIKLPTKNSGPGPSIQTAQLARATFTSTVDGVTAAAVTSTLTKFFLPTATPSPAVPRVTE